MISASLLRKTLGGKRKTIFASVNDQDGSVTAQNVEAVAKAYYIEGHDFTDGKNFALLDLVSRRILGFIFRHSC